TPDGKTLACGLSDGTVKLWDVTAGKELARLEGHRGRVWAIAFSPDGKTLASGAWDGTIKLWDVATGEEMAGFVAHDNRVYALAFSPDGKTLISGGGVQTKRGEVKLWDVAETLTGSGGKQKVVKEHISGAVRHPGEKRLRITGKVKVLDANTLV